MNVLDSDLKSIWVSLFFIHNSRCNYPICILFILLTSTEKEYFRTFYRIKIDPSVPEIFNVKDIIYKNGIDTHSYTYPRACFMGMASARTTNLYVIYENL